MKTALLLLTSVAVMACAPEPPQQASRQLGFQANDLSATVGPESDFFEHVNGAWLEATPIPPERSSYGVMQQMQQQTEVQLREILEAAAAAGAEPDSDLQKIGDLYKSFLDTETIEALALTPLDDELQRIQQLDSHAAVMAYFGRALLIGLQVPINFFIDSAADDPEKNIAYFWQDGLGLPDRDYYLQASGELADARAAYLTHIDKLHELAGWENEAGVGEQVLQLETALAERQWSRVQNRDRETIYRNQFSLAAAEKLSPALAWSSLLETGGFAAPEKFVVAQTDYFAALGELVTATPVATWKDYLRFKLLKAYAPYLTQSILEEDFRFEKGVLRGQPQMRKRWERGVRLVNGAIGELAGKEYVARHFPPESKARVEILVENLRSAFRQSIQQLDWMTDATRAEALAKLELFNAKIGYPEIWKDYSALIIRADDLVGNVTRARQWAHNREVAKLGKPVDRSEWGMTPQTINAYYRPTLNEIVFPAAILQPPFFNADADDAVNYGAIGAVIGHEFSHGFDDQGRKFDGEGRLRDWWTPADAAEYQRRAQGLIAQYDGFQPLPDQAINGELTLGENIADLAGVTIAYRAYQLSLNGNQAPSLDGFDAAQRFFMGYAVAWRTHYRDELLRQMLVRGPHSPARYRVNGVVRNLPAFQRAFDVSETAGMWLSPEERVQIW